MTCRGPRPARLGCKAPHSQRQALRAPYTNHLVDKGVGERLHRLIKRQGGGSQGGGGRRGGQGGRAGSLKY